MFDAAGNFGSVVADNLPISPSLPAASTLVCSNNTAGSGTYSMAFNTTSKTATFSSSSSLGSPQNFTVTYFGAGAVDPSEYEIRAEISSGPTTGANIALAGGSAALNTWITLGASPVFSFTCSGRRSGTVDLSITIRHKIQTTYTSTQVYFMHQLSDAVAPTFSGTMSMSTSYLSSESGEMGVYFDAGSSANQFQCRSYRGGSNILTNTLSFNTGGITESEYEIYNIETSNDNAGMTFNTGLGTEIGSRRGNAATSTSGSYWTINAVAGSYSGFIRVYIRHITDISKSNFVYLEFQKVT